MGLHSYFFHGFCDSILTREVSSRCFLASVFGQISAAKCVFLFIMYGGSNDCKVVRFSGFFFWCV